MLTFLERIETIQGWSRRRQGVARRLVFFSRLSSLLASIQNLIHRPRFDPTNLGYLPALNKELKVITPLHPDFRLILKFWNRLGDDISEQLNGKGNACWATSRSVTPRDHTSEVMV
jgi:hypothetical protein